MLDSAVRFDLDRERRIGLPEAVFCAGKPFDTLAGLFARFALRNAPPVLFTRLDAEVFAKIDPDTAGKYNFDPLSRTAWNAVRPRRPGVCAVVSAGSADAPVVMEAARTLEYLGYQVKPFIDCGVAGLWALKPHSLKSTPAMRSSALPALTLRSPLCWAASPCARSLLCRLLSATASLRAAKPHCAACSHPARPA